MTQSPERRRLVRIASAYNRKAQRLGIRGRITATDLLGVMYEQPGCRYCGIELGVKGTFDHYIPFDKGGQNAFSNIVRCCLTCNREKFTKSEDEFIAHRELVMTCEVCGKTYKPRWAEYLAGRARICSRSCSAKKRWQQVGV